MLKIKILQQEQSYILWQICVLRFFLNWTTEILARRLGGILFQITGAALKNALPPKVSLFIFASTRSRVLSLLDPQSTLHWRSPLRHTGALYVRNRTLSFSIHCQIGNQWSFSMVGEMCWYFLNIVISLAVEFCTFHNLFSKISGRPQSSLVYWWLGHVP